MKSREEYQASIFAKRDALLAKRKKRITQAVTAVCAVILLTASAAAIPSFIKKPAPDTVQAEHTTTVSDAYGSVITQPNADYDNLSESTEPVKDLAEAVTEEAEAAAEAVPEGATEMPTVVVRYPVSKEHSNISHTEAESTDNIDGTDKSDKVNIGSIIMNIINGVTEQPYSADTGGDNEDTSYEPEIVDESTKYTQSEIVSAAISFLPDSAKEQADPNEAFVTVTRTSEGEEYYEVRFDINGAKYDVNLDAENLDMIAVVSTNNSDSSTAAPQSQISPPYIPEQ